MKSEPTRSRPQQIAGYRFAVLVEKGETGYVATAPGVGGIYEEGATPDEAIRNAAESACFLLETRVKKNDPLTQDDPYLKVLSRPSASTQLISEEPMGKGHDFMCLLPQAAVTS